MTLGIWIVAISASLWFLRTAAELLIPIVVAVLISYALEPPIAWLRRQGVPRAVATTLVMVAVLGGAAAGAYSLRGNAMSALDSLPEAARRAREMVTSQLGTGPTQVQRASAEWQGEGRSAAPPQGGTAASDQASSAMQLAAQYSLAFMGHLTVVTFLVFFLLLSGPRLRDRIVEVAGPDIERQRMVAGILRDVDAQVQRFLAVQLATSAVVAAATWPLLAWLGMPNAVAWAVAAGVFNSIPYFGPVLVSGGLLMAGVVQGVGTASAIRMAGAALVITSLEGWLLTPALMGKAERMSALAVFIGLLVWTWLWGGWGTILAVPMLAVVKSAADRVDALKPLGRLMAP